MNPNKSQVAGIESAARIQAEVGNTCFLHPEVTWERIGKWGQPDRYVFTKGGQGISREELRKKYDITGCLFCGLGIPDFHTAAVALAARRS